MDFFEGALLGQVSCPSPSHTHGRHIFCLVFFASLVDLDDHLVHHPDHLLVLQEHLQEEWGPVWLWREGEKTKEQKCPEQEVQMDLSTRLAVPDPFCFEKK